MHAAFRARILDESVVCVDQLGRLLVVFDLAELGRDADDRRRAHVVVGVVRGADVVVGPRQGGARVPVQGKGSGAEAFHLVALGIESGRMRAGKHGHERSALIVLVAAFKRVRVLMSCQAGDGDFPFDGIERTLPWSPHRRVQGDTGRRVVGHQPHQGAHGQGACVDRPADCAGGEVPLSGFPQEGIGAAFDGDGLGVVGTRNGHFDGARAGNPGGELRSRFILGMAGEKA